MRDIEKGVLRAEMARYAPRQRWQAICRAVAYGRGGWRVAAAMVCAMLLTMLSSAHAALAVPVQQAFLVQNSGWMEPFYSDPASQFKPLIAAVADATTTASTPVNVLAFNQSSGNTDSPQVLFTGVGANGVAPSIASLGLARKADGAFADTDFREAIVKTITGSFHSQPGIVWIFTNNKNSPGNDQATAARNQDFYNLLHTEPSVVRTLVYPLAMPVKGQRYSASGLMVYALAYGEPAAHALDQILAEGRLAKVLTRPPARLKPLDFDPVRILPKSIENAPDVQVGLATDKRTVVLDVTAGKVAPSITMHASLQNLFFPYTIAQADVVATISSGAHAQPISVTPAHITQLQPGQTQSVEVHFRLPVESVPSPWSMRALAAMGKQVIIPMTVQLRLGEQTLVVSDRFKSDLERIFPGDPISSLFSVPGSVRGSQAIVPVVLRVQYPLLPVIVIALLILLTFASLLLLWMLSSKAKRFSITVDGMQKHVVLKPFRAVDIKDANGMVVGVVKRGLGRPQPVRVVHGHSIRC